MELRTIRTNQQRFSLPAQIPRRNYFFSRKGQNRNCLCLATHTFPQVQHSNLSLLDPISHLQCWNKNYQFW